MQVPETKATTGPHDYFNYGQKTSPLIKFYREDWKASVPSESSITEDASQGSVRIKVASTTGTDSQGNPFYSAGTQIRLTQQRTLSDGTVVRGNTDANDYWLQGLTARPESETILQEGVPVMERHQIKVRVRVRVRARVRVRVRVRVGVSVLTLGLILTLTLTLTLTLALTLTLTLTLALTPHPHPHPHPTRVF